MVWSVIFYGCEIVVIGYQLVGFENIEECIYEIDVIVNEWCVVCQELIDLVLIEM